MWDRFLGMPEIFFFLTSCLTYLRQNVYQVLSFGGIGWVYGFRWTLEVNPDFPRHVVIRIGKGSYIDQNDMLRLHGAHIPFYSSVSPIMLWILILNLSSSKNVICSMPVKTSDRDVVRSQKLMVILRKIKSNAWAKDTIQYCPRTQLIYVTVCISIVACGSKRTLNNDTS